MGFETCEKCNKIFNYDKYFGICPNCGRYNQIDAAGEQSCTPTNNKYIVKTDAEYLSDNRRPLNHKALNKRLKKWLLIPFALCIIASILLKNAAVGFLLFSAYFIVMPAVVIVVGMLSVPSNTKNKENNENSKEV